MTTQENLNEMISEERKNYNCPAIIHELDLETRAGSPLGIVDPMDINGDNP